MTGTATYEIPTFSRPARGASVDDPNFHTTIFRVTDGTIDAYSDPGINNEYARTDPENCDGTLLILRTNNSGQWYLYNAQTMQMIKYVAIAGGGEEPDPRWDPAISNKFYYLYGTQLKSYDTDNDTTATVHDFASVSSEAAYITTKVEGDASLDRRYWCFMVERSDYSLIKVVSYDKNTNSILGSKGASSLPSGIGLNWVSMDMSGNHCVLGYEDDGAGYTPPIDTFTRTFTHVATLPAGSTGHMDLALDSVGNDVMVYQNNATDWIAMADLNTGAETNLVAIPFGTNPDIGLHFSGNCSQTPGWVMVSTSGSRNPPSGSTHSWMDSALFMVELKTSPRIWRIANTHCYTSDNYPPPSSPPGPNTYFWEAYATINRSGTRVYWGSNWETYVDGYTETYRITLPSNWATSIP